ncbi:MAG: hypothetical protein ACM3NQ_04175 [Bacteroidales bacterium]
MRIAFDLDGTLADLQAVLAEAAERMFGPVGAIPAAAGQRSAAPARPVADALHPAALAEESPDDEPVPPSFHELGAGDQRRLWQSVLDTENFWETLNETEPGIVARLAVLALERRWEVIFITQRPPSAGDTCQLQSQRWLVRHGFALPSVYVLRGSRGKVATALDLDVVVDDRPDNCLDVVVESKARAFLVWRGDMSGSAPVAAKRLKIDVVQSVGECLDLLAAEREGKSGGIMSKLKRLMGSA